MKVDRKGAGAVAVDHLDYRSDWKSICEHNMAAPLPMVGSRCPGHYSSNSRRDCCPAENMELATFAPLIDT